MDGEGYVGWRIRPYAPTLLAVLLAAAAWPLTALSLDTDTFVPTTESGPLNLYVRELGIPLSATDPGRWAATGGAVFAAALVAGTIGGVVVRRHAITGALFTVVAAWIVGIVAMPVLPALLGRFTSVNHFCVDACLVMKVDGEPFAGLKTAIFFFTGPMLEPVAFTALVIGVAVWAVALRGSPRRWHGARGLASGSDPGQTACSPGPGVQGRSSGSTASKSAGTASVGREDRRQDP